MIQQDPRQSESQKQPKQDNQSKQDGQQKSALKFIYNVTPSTKQTAFNAAIPNAVHYNPFSNQLDVEVHAQNSSLVCHRCGSYYNRHCDTNVGKKIWICCICRDHNALPDRVSASLNAVQTYDVTSEGVKDSVENKQAFYLFVIDLCVSDKQLKAIKDSLIQFVEFKANQNYEGVNLISRMGIISYNKFVYCYQLANILNTVVCISANHTFQPQQILKFLSLNPDNAQPTAQKYFPSIKQNRQKIVKRIQKLKAEQSVKNNNDPHTRCRSHRAFGQALNVALTLSRNLNNFCRIVNFIGGPCTHGIGVTIGTDFRQQMRSITEVDNGENVHFFQSSQNFYKNMAKRIQARKTIIDLFIFSIEQVGLTQMYSLARSSGGLLVLGQQFSGELQIFQNSFKKAYISSEQNQMSCSLVSSCLLTVTCSSDIKINGALGCCKPIQSVKGKQFISQKSIGFGDTNVWYIGGMDCYKTLTFFYQLSSPKAFDSAYFIQFKLSYKDYWGFKKTRITTAKRLWDTNSTLIAQNFDQEAAIVALARWYLHRAQFEPKINLRQWIDKLLVRWATNFANFIRGDSQSFSLPQKMKFLPQFIYHFRRSPIARRTGLSLDQLTYYSHALNIETVGHCLTIIQPALLSYTIQKPFPSPVTLQQQQMKNSVILLLDTHFYVLLWYGENIEYWQKQQFHKQKQYQHVKYLLEAPNEDIQYLLNNRFPYPGFYKASVGHSKERILKSKVSPMVSDNPNENILTDDKSIKVFMKALIQIIIDRKSS